MSSDFAQLVKQQADIVKIVGEYITLKKAGAQNFTGLCPFHGEKTPSFSVHAVRQFYHCFGCGEGGDVFSFVQKIENLGFTEAVKVVAQKCGIPLPKREFSSPEEAQENRQRARLLELHELATSWFEEQLRSPEGARAREYLTGRGVSGEAIAKFRIGYAPDSFNALRDRLQSVAPLDLLRLSGLLSSKEQQDGSSGPLYARFRKRITFPIHNESGRVIAFTARALDSDEKNGPKYLNSPETPLYSKGQVLFNLDKARQSIRQQDFALLVEGQMDCITAYMAGIQNVLATSGTAFTEMQVRLLSRYTKRLFINFDPDAAGANAAEKSIALLTEEGFEVKVVTLEAGLDPDRYIRERGIQDYVTAVKSARRHSDYLIDRAMQLFPVRTGEGKSKALNYLLPHIRRMPNSIVRDEFASDAAQKLGIDSALVREELRVAARKRKDEVRPASADPLTEAEKVLLRAAASAQTSRSSLRVFEALHDQPEYFESLSVTPILLLLRDRGSLEPLAAISDPAQRMLLAQALFHETGELELRDVEAALHSLRHRHLEALQRRVRADIAEAERRGDLAQLAAFMAEKLKVDRQMREADT
ncbi:MAG TPA: DNA primase [Acidobacteriaceae bacterium]|nr:DNA primase [Acidobacteriaceae bacterium]